MMHPLKHGVAWGIPLIFVVAGISRGDFTGKGHVHVLSETRQVFLNQHCAATDTCDLKRFMLTTVVNEIWFSDDPNHPTYGNGVIMEYETDSLAALEKYAIVQFQKGCVFQTSKNREGKIHRSVRETIASFGEDVPFCFPQWVIDSRDTDPSYNSDPEYGRFHLLRWNEPRSYDYQTQKFYGAEKPKTPVVYMTDYPAGAYVGAAGVKNVALRFNTCIFKAGDVPAKTRRENIDFAKPVSCFEWQNVYVYDFATATFRTDWPEVPGRAEPSVRVNADQFVGTIALLLIALALVVFVQSRQP